ncbi:hypothetical protein ACKWTF_014891 [Chironomus riparius]
MAIKEIFVILSLLCGFGDSVDIQCDYGTDFYFAVDFVYQCKLQNTLNIKSRESAVISSVNGSHSSGKTSADVTGFWSSFSAIEYFPRNLDNIFTNLEIILINNGRLKEIQQSDLRPFTKLGFLSLSDNEIVFLEDGLFAYNPELEYVGFAYNKIIQIGSQVFDNLNKLTWLWLLGNKCINMDANNNQTAVKEVISQAKVKCYNSEYLKINNELIILEKSFCKTLKHFPTLISELNNLQSRLRDSKFSSSPILNARIKIFDLTNIKMVNRTTKHYASTIKIVQFKSIIIQIDI